MAGAMGLVIGVVAGATPSGAATVSLRGIPVSAQVARPVVSGNTITIPLGNGQSVHWTKGQKLHIAYLTIGSTNNYLVEENQAVVNEAKRFGASVTTYDGNFDAQTQIDQLQTVLSSHKYNAIVANPVDPQLECKQLSQSAAQDNMLVSVIVGPLCDRAESDGVQTWVPGTLNFVGGDGQPAALEAYFQAIAKANPGKQDVALLVGPQDNPPSINAVNAMQAVVKQHPNFHLVATYYTDYSSQQAYTDTQDLLQAHPDTTIIVNSYVELTVGEVSAISRSGGSGKVKLYDKGGATWDSARIKAGQLAMDLPQYPISNGKLAVDSLELAVQGKPVPRFIGNDGHSTKGEPLYVTKKNVGSFTPQYNA